MCRLAAAVGVDNAAEVVRRMLLAQQHGGQEGAGIATEHDGKLYIHKGLGLVDEVFSRVDLNRELPGRSAIGHLRYATAGGTHVNNVQPLDGVTRDGPMVLAHNGNASNYEELRQQLFKSGCVLRTDSDTELILSLLGHVAGATLPERLVQMYQQAQGAITLLTLVPGMVCVSQDPFRWRPAAYAEYQDGILVASESRAFKIFGIKRWHQVPPGCIIAITANGQVREIRYATAPERRCVFEKVYFAMPDSEIYGDHVGQQRRQMGTALGRRISHLNLDGIIPVPDSANVAAEAISKESGVPLIHGLVRSKYAGRTFITPTQEARELGVRMKLSVDESVVKSQRVGVVDDSIVRGTTMRQIAQLLFEAGAVEVHLLVSSPPVIHPCHWGIDTPHRQQLLAARVPLDRLAEELGVTSVTYLTETELMTAVGDPESKSHCNYCFTGCKPVAAHRLPNE